jgi:tetratricopeptide (TPR) repeat protein
MLEDIMPLIDRGYYEEALEKIEHLNDPLERVEALARLAVAIYQKGGPGEWIPSIIDDASYIAQSIETPYDRALALAIIASALAKMGYSEEASDFFETALEETEDIEDPLERGYTLAFIAYHLAISGYSEQAMETFDVAFRSMINAEVSYSSKVDGLLRIADFLEKSGDAVPAADALKFYGIAFDIFDKLNVNQRAAIVEKKIELTKTVYDVGLPEIREALLQGKNHYALAILEKKYTGVMRLIGELEVALWMKRVNNPEYLDVIERAFSKCENPQFTETNVQTIARLLTSLGSLRRALTFALKIADERKKSEAMNEIAVELAREGDFEDASKLALNIPIREIRDEAILEIEAIKEEQA